MATYGRSVWRVLSGCQRLSAARSVYSGLSQTSLNTVPMRTLSAQTKKKEGEEKKAPEPQRHKPVGKTAWAPVDDVYILRYYPRKIYGAEEAVELLKTYRRLDFTPENQPVYINLKLDMKLEKKKKVDQFVSTVTLPHRIQTEMNKVLVFTENPKQVKIAQENGADIVGGKELVPQVLEGKISADFYIAVPEVLQIIEPLKPLLRKQFPKSKRGTVGVNIAKMVEVHKTGHQYLVQNDCYVKTQIATLDMPSEQIMENLLFILTDVCSHKPPEFGPFIERAILTSQTSEAIWFNTEDLFAKPTEEAPEEELDY